MSSKPPHIIVVGARIVGASIAYHLARRKARVTLLDCANSPAQEVTSKSFAWITAAHNAPKAHLDFCQQAITDWRRLENELGGALKITWSGAMSWYKDMTEAELIVSKLNSSSYKIRLVDQQEIRHLEPNLKIVPEQALYAENEGALDAALVTRLLIEAARKASVRLNTEVLALTTNGARITGVVTKEGELTADLIVLATGTGTAELCQPLGLKVPVDVSPAILMKFHTPHRFVNRIVSNPAMEIRAASDQLLLAAENYIDESVEDNPQAIAARTLSAIKKHWLGSEQVNLTDVIVGKRPVPRDGQPIIGRAPDLKGLYLAIMHPGITLAALAGRLVADEILKEQDDISLNPYRVDRFS